MSEAEQAKQRERGEKDGDHANECVQKGDSTVYPCGGEGSAYLQPPRLQQDRGVCMTKGLGRRQRLQRILAFMHVYERWGAVMGERQA